MNKLKKCPFSRLEIADTLDKLIPLIEDNMKLLAYELSSLHGASAELRKRADGWISVDDKPNENEKVLICNDFGIYDAEYRHTHFWIVPTGMAITAEISGWYSDEEVSYWQPLPEKPKGENQ